MNSFYAFLETFNSNSMVLHDTVENELLNLLPLIPVKCRDSSCSVGKSCTSRLVTDGSASTGLTVKGRGKRNDVLRPGHHEFHIGSSETFRRKEMSKTARYISQGECKCECTEKSGKT
jgi:hypothetical protein